MVQVAFRMDDEIEDDDPAVQIPRLEAEIERSERKLADHGFVSKAPTDVVDAEREGLARLRDEAHRFSNRARMRAPSTAMSRLTLGLGNFSLASFAVDREDSPPPALIRKEPLTGCMRGPSRRRSAVELRESRPHIQQVEEAS